MTRFQKSRSLMRLFPWLLCLALLIPLGAQADYTTVVDPATRYQTLEGWGTSLAWWPNVIGGFPEPYRTDYINKVFDPVQGLGLNIVRYNIGGGEAPGKHYMGLREAVPGYEPAPGKWDWTADANQRLILFASIKKGVNQFEAFSNSPPYWMTRSGSVTGMPDGSDNLDPKYNQAFADYLTQVVAHFHDHWNLTFRTLEPLNEPTGGWWKMGNHQEGCHFSRPAETAIVNATIQSLAKRKSPTVTSASDENNIDDMVTTWNAFDDSARRGVGQINTHSYSGSARAALRRIAARAGKRLWMSEYGDGDASGMTMSERILSDMKIMRPVAWVYWQAVDGGGWGLLVNNLRGAPNYSYRINEKYYVLANYTRFVRPGDTIVDIDDSHSLAAYNLRAGKLAIVTTNNGNTPVTVTYDLSRFHHLPATLNAYRTSPTENLVTLPPLPIIGKGFAAALPAHSVTTFVIEGATGVQPGTAPQFDPNATYNLINLGSGDAMSVPSKTPAAGVIQDTLGVGESQQWSLVATGDGYYEIVNRMSGLSLDVNKAATTPGANVIQWTENGGLNQEWKIVPAVGGSYALLNHNSGLALDTDAAGLVQSIATMSAAQRWRVVPSKKK